MESGDGKKANETRDSFRRDALGPFVHRSAAVSEEIDGDVKESGLAERAGNLFGDLGATIRGMSALGTSIRATPSWARTRTTRKPNARIAPSAASTRCSFSTVITSPYAIREDRQALLGLSKKLRSSSRAKPRTSDFVKPNSTSGCQKPASFIAWIPGRWSPRSETFTPSAIAWNPSSAARVFKAAPSSWRQK